ncbi:MAG: hypothetical protein Q4Q37_07085 [Methanobrevibacter sp.]|nr:hypothetical protein [Methanobrevibacter sp.]
MNRKITLILSILVLAAVSLSIVTAVNDTSDSIAASEDSVLDETNEDVVSDDLKLINDDDPTVRPNELSVKKVWVDNDNASGKRPSSIKFF